METAPLGAEGGDATRHVLPIQAELCSQELSSLAPEPAFEGQAQGVGLGPSLLEDRRVNQLGVSQDVLSFLQLPRDLGADGYFSSCSAPGHIEKHSGGDQDGPDDLLSEAILERAYERLAETFQIAPIKGSRFLSFEDSPGEGSQADGQGQEHDGSGPAASLQPEECAGSDQQAGDRS